MTRLQRELHRRVWLAMLVLIPVACVLALQLRHTRTVALSAAEQTKETRP